jgi:hypothetical protein
MNEVEKILVDAEPGLIEIDAPDANCAVPIGI